MSKRLLIAALLATLAGCQTSWSIHGQVASVPAGMAGQQNDEVVPEPLGRAKVTLRCPTKSGKFHDRGVVADSLGRFEFDGSGTGPSLECVVIAEAPGHTKSVTPMDEACADDGEGEGRCVSATMLAELERLK